MIFAYKIFTEKIGLEKDDIFTPSVSAIRGHKYRVIKNKATKLCRINTFSNRIINDWNSLPEKVVASESTNSFKNAIDEYWKEDQFATPF